MSAYFFGLIACIGWGSGDIFGAIASRKTDAYSTTFWSFVIATMISSLYIPWAIGDLVKITPFILSINLLLGIFYVAGQVGLNEALKESNAPIIGTIVGSWPALTILLSFFFFGERVSLAQAGVIGLIALGVCITSLGSGSTNTKHSLTKKSVLIALFCLIAWGFYFTFIKVLMKEIGWFWPNYISALLFPLIYFYMKWSHLPLRIPQRSVTLPIALNAITLRGADFAFNIGASMGLTATVAPIGGAYPTLFAILSYFVFRDPLNKKQIMGIIIALTGLVLLGFT